MRRCAARSRGFPILFISLSIFVHFVFICNDHLPSTGNTFTSSFLKDSVDKPGMPSYCLNGSTGISFSEGMDDALGPGRCSCFTRMPEFNVDSSVDILVGPSGFVLTNGPNELGVSGKVSTLDIVGLSVDRSGSFCCVFLFRRCFNNPRRCK